MVLVGAIVVAYVVLPYLQADALAHPVRTRVCCLTPSDYGLPFTDVSFLNEKGQQLRGWYIPSHNRAAIIVAHSAGANRAQGLGQAAALASGGYGVLLIDLRGHGESEGDAVSFGGGDVGASVTFLQGRPDVDRERIGVIGMSLGAIVALQAASETDAIKAVVADGSGPTGFDDEPPPTGFNDYLKLPMYWIEYQVWKWQGVAAPRSIVDAIPRISPRPVLLIAAGQNKSELDLNRRFYQAAAEPKELWVVEQGHHLEGWSLRRPEYGERVLQFFDRALLQ